MNKVYIYLLFFLIPILSFSQSQEIDSLKTVIKNENIDKSKSLNLLYKKLKKTNPTLAKTYLDQAYIEAQKYNNLYELGATLNYLGYYYKYKSKLDTALILFNQSLKVRKEINDTIGISKVYNNLGSLYLDKSLYRKAAESLEKALHYKLLLEDKKGAGISYNALGNTYNKWGKNKIAIEYYQKALKMFEEVNFLYGVSSCYNNIGLIYQNLAKGEDTILFNKAFEYYKQALEINTRTNNLWEISDVQSNMANIYTAKAEQYQMLSNIGKTKNPQISLMQKAVSEKYFKEAIVLVEQSAKNKEIVGDRQGLAGSYVGLGAIFINKGGKKEAKQALEAFNKALKISLEIKDSYLTTVCYSYIGIDYINLGNPLKAIENLKKAEEIAKTNSIKREYAKIYDSFSEAYDSLGNYKLALKYHRLFKSYQDSAYTKQNMQIITDMQTKYETNQKEAALKIANQENEKQQLQSKQQMLIIYGFSGVFVLIIIFSFVVFRQFKQIQKSNKALSEQKDEIQHQKDHIEEIHKEVSDSIHYAERIQKAILPQIDDIEGKIADRFILFKPKDIVSGDFYWQKDLKKSNLFIATAADCTGHGVPGAFMSMLGVAFLNEIVNKPNVKSSGEVLDSLRQSVITSLHQTGKEGEAQDGMDISLIAYNYKTKVVMFSGANNPLYIIRSNNKAAVTQAEKTVKGETHTLYEIKGDKMPIGIYKKELVDFTTVEIQLESGDQMYMFSDGYADQFGGPKGKKLKYKPFKQLLLGNTDKSMSEQASILNEYFENWRGMLEQIDDVIVMGIKV